MEYFLITEDADILTGFGLAGIRGVQVDSHAHCMQEIEKAAARKEIAILLITHSLANLCRPQIDYLKHHARHPLVVEIPVK